MENARKILLALLLSSALLLAGCMSTPGEYRPAPVEPHPGAQEKKAVLILTFDVENPYGEGMYQPYGYVDPEPTPLSEATVPRILELLEGKGVKATFFLVGWTADNYPELVDMIIESGSEAAVHGYMHAPIPGLNRSQRAEELGKSLDAVGRHGISKGFRAPLMQIDDALLGELSALGFGYDSSYDRFFYPERRPFKSGDIVELPVDRPNDWEAYESHKSTGADPFPEDTWLRYRKERLDNAVEEGDVVVQLHHPWVIGRDEKRLEDLGAFLDHAKGYEAQGRLEILTCAEYVERYW